MDKPPYYVLLTGGKNNAGDFLIKSRAFDLLKHYRPDRDIVDINGYEPITEELLSVINNAEALLLTGGPALVKNMVPKVYNITHVLDEIKCPIILFGIGWHSERGLWSDTHNYPLGSQTKALLQKLDARYQSSVRDYHTMNVLNLFGLDNIVMTGCPALYDVNFIRNGHDDQKLNHNYNRIGFSLGVSFKNSPKMERQSKDVILALRDNYKDSKLDVVFHHALPTENEIPSGVPKRLNIAQVRFRKWLDSHNIHYVDISGSADHLKRYYSSTDLHVGFRVHAHIFMSSIGKDSVLLSEDGRGKALSKVIGGASFEAFDKMSENKFIQRLHRIGLPIDAYLPSQDIHLDVINTLKNWKVEPTYSNQVESNIRIHHKVMSDFLMQLP